MNTVLGERYVTGVGVEGTRGTLVSAQDFIRAREPASIQTSVDKVDIQETEASGMATKGQVTTMRRVTGDLPVNIRFRTYGYLLKSLMGGVSSAVETGETGNGVYRHTFTVDPDNLQPSLSLSLTRGSFDHFGINGAVVSQLTENYPLDDVVNATATIMGRTESVESDFTPAFTDDDHLAPHQYVTIKIADDVAGLDAAEAICVTSITNEMNRNTTEKKCQSSLDVLDFKPGLMRLSGNFTWDKTADTYRDLGLVDTEKALRISVVNTGVTIGTASNPTLEHTFDRVTFTTEEERPIDDTVTETVNWIAHGVTTSLVNEKADYNAA